MRPLPSSDKAKKLIVYWIFFLMLSPFLLENALQPKQQKPIPEKVEKCEFIHFSQMYPNHFLLTSEIKPLTNFRADSRKSPLFVRKYKTKISSRVYDLCVYSYKDGSKKLSCEYELSSKEQAELINLLEK